MNELSTCMFMTCRQNEKTNKQTNEYLANQTDLSFTRLRQKQVCRAQNTRSGQVLPFHLATSVR